MTFIKIASYTQYNVFKLLNYENGFSEKNVYKTSRDIYDQQTSSSKFITIKRLVKRLPRSVSVENQTTEKYSHSSHS